MPDPSLPTVKRLYAVSGNRCAFPRCPLPLIDEQSGKVTGRVCHIKAKNPGGPRYDSTQTDAQRNNFDNLILLCPIHHDVIDSDVEAYTVDRLSQMKRDHETTNAGTAEPPVEVAAALLDASHATVSGSVILAVNQSGGQTAHSITNVFHPTPEQNSAASTKLREKRVEVCGEVWQKLLEVQGPAFQLATGSIAVPDLNKLSEERFAQVLEDSDLPLAQKLELYKSKDRNAAYREIAWQRLLTVAYERWRDLHNYATATRIYLPGDLRAVLAEGSSLISGLITRVRMAKSVADVDYEATDSLMRKFDAVQKEVERLITREFGRA